jgi:hypothetical protein
MKPLSPSELKETLEAIADSQRSVNINLEVYLRCPSENGLARLAEARHRDDELFKIVLHIADDEELERARKQKRACAEAQRKRRAALRQGVAA